MSSSLDAAAAPVQPLPFRFPSARADQSTPTSSSSHARSLSAALTERTASHRLSRSLSYTNTPAPFLLQHEPAVLRNHVRSWNRPSAPRPTPLRASSARSLRPLSILASPRRFSLANDACSAPTAPSADRPRSCATPRSPTMDSPSSPRSASLAGMVIDLEELLSDTKSPALLNSFSSHSPSTPHNFSGPESPEAERSPPSAQPTRPAFRRQSSQFSVEQLPSSPLASEIESFQRASYSARTRRGQSITRSPPIVIMLRTSTSSVSAMPTSDSISSIASTSTHYDDAPEYSVSFAPEEPARPRAYTTSAAGSRSPRQGASSSRLLVDDTGSSTETDRTPTVASQAAFHTPKRQTGRSHRRMLSDTDAMLARAATASVAATAASSAAARPGHARRRSRTLFEAKVKAQSSRRRTRELSGSSPSLEAAGPHTPSPRPSRRSEPRQASLRPSSAEKIEHVIVSPELKDDDATLYAAISFIDGGYNAGSPLGGSDTSPGSSQGSMSWIDTPKGSLYSPLSPFHEAHRATSHLAEELEVWSSSDDDDEAAGAHAAPANKRKTRSSREMFSTPDASPMMSLAGSARQTVVLQASALSLRLKSAERLSSLTRGKLVQQEALQQAVQSQQPQPQPQQPRRAARQLPPKRDGQSLTGQPLPALPTLPTLPGAMDVHESPKGTLSSDQPTFASAHHSLSTGPRMASAEARTRSGSSTSTTSTWSFASTAAGIMCIPGDEMAMIQRDATGLGISSGLTTPSASPTKPIRPERSLRRPSATDLTVSTTALLQPQAATAPKKRSSRSGSGSSSRRRHTGPRLDAALPKTPARMASLEHCVAAPSARKQLNAPPPARPLLGAWMSESITPQLAPAAFQFVTVPPTPDPTAPTAFESPRQAPRAPSPADKSLPPPPVETSSTGTSFASSASVATFVARVTQQAGAEAATFGTSPSRPQASGGLRARLTAKLRSSTSSLTLRSEFAQVTPPGSARSERSSSEPEEIVAFSPTGPRPSLPVAMERNMWSASLGRSSISHLRSSNGSVASLGSVISAEAEAEEDLAFARSSSSMSRRMSPFVRRKSTTLHRASETWSRSSTSMERHGSASSAASSASSTDSYSMPPPMVRTDSSATTATVSSFSDSEDDEELDETTAHDRVDKLRGSLRRTPSRLGLNALAWPRARKASLDVVEQPYMAPPKSATRRSSLFGMNVWA